MNRQNVNPNFKFGDTDGFMLTDLDTDQTVMLIPCDTAGNFSWTGVTRAPLQRNAMKTSNTSNQYSDLEPPWISIPQENWTGGRGNATFTKDTTRYFDGKRAQAAFNEVIFNGPLDYYSNGFRKAETNCPGSVQWKKMLPGKEKYVAVSFKPSSNMTAGEIYIHLRRRGTPVSPLVVELVSSLSASSALASHSYTIAEITDTLSEFAKFTFTGVSLTSGTTYYIRIHADNGSSDSYWQVGYKVDYAQNSYYSSDGTHFNSANFEIYYRIAEAQANYQTKFFTYEQIPFMVRQKVGTTPTLWMNGDIGKVTSSSSTTITSTGKTWGVNAYAGARVGLIYQAGSQEHIETWKTIKSNTADTITIDGTWDITPSANCEFVITDTPLWNQITGHGLTSYVTDVHVIHGVVYFAQGDYVNARKMRWNNGAFEWKEITGIKAAYLQSVRDSSGMMLYRANNDGINHKRSVERSRLLDWMSSEKTWTKVTTAITTKEPEDKSVTKTVITEETALTPDYESTHQETTEVTDSTKPDESDITVTATKTSKLGGQNGPTIETITTGSHQTVTKATLGTETTVTTTLDTSKSTEQKDYPNPSAKSVTTTLDTTIGGVTVSDTESVSESSSAVVTISGNTKTTTTTDSTTTTTHKNPELPLRTSIATESKDFDSADYDAKQYVIQIDNLTSENYTGKCVITLQESEDNLAFTDVETVTAIGTGKWYIFAHCQYRYRRFIITAIGVNTVINNITISTSQTPHFEDPVVLQDNFGKITRLFEYGAEMTKSLWIVQEGMLSSINKVDGTVNTYTHDRINLDELQTTAEMWNGKAMATADVYLLWGWLNGLQRYYNTQLEGKGPDHDEGLPFNRQGRITQIVSYPSNFFISIDGKDGYSSVMQFNGSGWHEIYRAPNPGERIYDMCFEPVYGERPDKLWLNVGDDVVWLSMPSKILYAIQDQHAEYTHESVLVSAWHTAGMADIEKLWQTLKIMADNLDGKHCWIEADYQIDEEEEWHPIENWYTVSPSQKEDLNPYKSVNGKKFRYRLRLQTTDYHMTPKVNVVVLECVGRVDIKMSYVFYFRNIKYKRDLNAEFEDIEPLEVQDILDDWANKLKKLRLNSRWKIFDDKLVYLDAVQTSVLNELSEGYIGQITLNEL